ncbi:DUF6484 domain-containing protein [Roseateles sp.]|uniref:DUF6484 domain-containing protein n=1 Tax=Roseateles sp. TaxID=1971397 RepID=UPI0039EAAC9E
MDRATDPFIPLVETAVDDFDALERRDMSSSLHMSPAMPYAAPAIARLRGFDLLEQPLIHALAAHPGEVLACRSTVVLRQAMVGRDVLVLFEGGDTRKPIIVGLIEPAALQPAAPSPSTIQVDGSERQLIEAEREIVLRCGDASITLTRAGKVIIKGNYVLSRSTGYNKIKGAAVDIN